MPAPYQDVLDFAYYSGWRKREILDLRWDEVDEPGGVVRLSPQRSKTRVGRVLPISPPIAAVLARRRATRRAGQSQVFHRDDVTVLQRLLGSNRCLKKLGEHMFVKGLFRSVQLLQGCREPLESLEVLA